jgi:ATP-dependent Clp protease adaptor protein ClpS
MSAYVSSLTFIRPDAPQLHGSATMAVSKAATKGEPPPATPEPNFADGGELVVERQEKKTVPPPLYQVVLLNDDYTPMEFVVAVIERFFNKDHETAVQIMLMVHMKGKGVCGVFSRDIAASKVEQVQAAARKAGHPLQCLMEAA